MNRLAAPRLVLLGCAWTFLAPAAPAQCPDWEPVGPYPGADGPVYAFATHDDGSGSKLYAAGLFSEIAGVAAGSVARWDGTSWEQLGGGVMPSDKIEVLRVLDLGGGPELYAGGRFTEIDGVPANSIARWDGTQWQPLGSGLNYAGSPAEVVALEVFDDGSGPALYVGGHFNAAGSVSLAFLARWDGASWSDPGQASNRVHALQVFDDGSGPALYAGGWMKTIAGVSVNSIARFDGTSWSALGSGMTGTGPVVQDFAIFDDGGGPALYLCGRFLRANGLIVNNVSKWDGTGFSKLGNGVVSSSSTVDARDLEVLDDGSGSALYVGGQIVSASGVSSKGVARWDGSSWSGVGSGVVGYNPVTMGVHALGAYDDGNGEQLFVGGFLAVAGKVGAANLARWDGSAWHGWGSGFDYRVLDLALHDDGTGPALYASGQFEIAGAAIANMVGRLGPAGWEGLDFPWGHGTPVYVSAVDALASFDDGGGPALFIAANDPGTKGIVYRWRGGVWTLVQNFEDAIHDLVEFDDGSGPALYASGQFTKVGGAPARGVARYDGTSWTEVGGGIPGYVYALAPYDSGSGLELYAGGIFLQAGSVPALHVARWDGISWKALIDPAGGLRGTDDDVYGFAVHDDGSGPALYVGGLFENAGRTAANHIARWDGTTWSPLGAGLGTGYYDQATSLASYDDGGGSQLFVGGQFDSAGGLSAGNFAAWDGKSWRSLPAVQSPPGSGLRVDKLLTFDLGDGPRLAIGGLFDTVGGQPSPCLAFWKGCSNASLALTYCLGDGSLVPCPCGNQVAPGTQAGCANSTGLGGRLTASGNVSVAVGDLELTASQLPPGMPGVLSAASSKPPTPFGDGLLCVAPPLVRFPVAFADPSGAFSVSGIVAYLGLAAGQTRGFQVWYRDPSGPCGTTYNLTDALAIAFTP